MEWLGSGQTEKRNYRMKKKHLLSVLDDLFKNPGERTMQNYRIFTSAGGRDILILLTWDTEKGEKSQLGSIIAEELGHFGLVAHSVWGHWQPN